MAERILYDTILARSFSKHEQKKLGYGALVACFLLALSLCTVFKPYWIPLTDLNLRLSMGVTHKLLSVNETSSGTNKFQEVVNDTNSSRHSEMQRVNETRSSQNVLPETNETSGSDDNIMTLVANMESSIDEAPAVNDTNGTSSSDKMKKVNGTSSSQKIVMVDVVPKRTVPVCNIGSRSDYCEIINGDTRIDGKSATVFIASSDYQAENNSSWRIKPYARKGDVVAMGNVREWTVKNLASDDDDHQHRPPMCTKNHTLPAVIFSNGGYAGNNFHEFTDIVIPLYLTARQFNGEVQFLITDKRDFWIWKFKEVIKSLSKYDAIDIDREDGIIHCFNTVIVGLKRPHGDKELTVDPSKSPHSMTGFRQFLRSSYSLKKGAAIKLRDGVHKRPQLLIISRKRTRAFTNTGQIAKMARRLGFKVVVAELDMNVTKTAQIVNSCDVLLGVHGAGLTNIVFLPEKAVLIQVLPFGGFEWLARFYFEEPSKDMHLKYLDYKIKIEESTLIQQYPPGHEALRDPTVIQKQGWNAFKSVYLDNQNVNLDVNRFRDTLIKALELLHR